MKNTKFLDAIGEIDDIFIFNAQNRMNSQPHHAHHKTRKTLLVIAAVMAVLVVLSTVAFASSKQVRDFFISIFTTQTPQEIPSIRQTPGTDKQINMTSSEDIDDEVISHHIQGGGYFSYSGSLFCVADVTDVDERVWTYYRIEEDELVSLPTEKVKFNYTFWDTEFIIDFDYTIYEGKIHTQINPQYSDMEQYQKHWRLIPYGDNTDLVWLMLAYKTDTDYAEYPMLLNVKTLDITDTFKDVEIPDGCPYNWTFSSDSSMAIIDTWFNEDGHNCYLWKESTEKITDFADLTDTDKMLYNPYIIDKRHILIYAYYTADENVDLLCYDPQSGTVRTIVENERYRHSEDDYGIDRYGYFTLMHSPDGSKSLINNITGRSISLDDVAAIGDFDMVVSSDRQHIFFLYTQSDTEKGCRYYDKIGMLDTVTGKLQILNRNHDSAQYENAVFAQDKTICIWAQTADSDSPQTEEEIEFHKHNWHVYTYTFE